MAEAKSGNVVKVHYTGKLNDGKIFDSSTAREPIKFTIGENKVIPAFEEAIIGMEIGNSKTIKIPAEQAYGNYDEALIRTLSRKVFPKDMEPEVGQRLTAKQADGRAIHVKVTEVSESDVKIDANHPLAGEELTFDIELLEIV
ncbi:MAG: FKBP-type peptidyl-prolyl cis-trans isomerase [Planctomycetota bacterium]|jgi:peptidylprolyl isomerase